MRRFWIFILALTVLSGVPSVHGQATGGGNAGGGGAGGGAGGAGGGGGGGGGGTGGAGAGAGANGIGRGKKSGDYTYTVAGEYKGTGTGSVTDTIISISLNVQIASGGQTFNLNFNNLPLVDDHFTGTANNKGLTFTITGRVDLPAATDPQQTPEQAITGRVTATLSDANGKGARVVAIQDESSRGRGH